MWKRFAKSLKCPLCTGDLELRIFSSEKVLISDEHRKLAIANNGYNADFNVYVDSGVLLCNECKHWYPIHDGLPVLLPYPSTFRNLFLKDFSQKIDSEYSDYETPGLEPPPGEHLVMQSFSTEWSHYDFDGVIWELDYADYEQRFLGELGLSKRAPRGSFLELGCGLGITTALAQKNLAYDAVGVDLSVAAMRATKQYRTNPFLHFVQASVFHLPFREEAFDLIYSRGVLHHTYSTQAAMSALTKLARPGGLMYVWLYGPGSINDNIVRRVAYAAEVALRLFLNRTPAWVEPLVLTPMALAYVVANAIQRIRVPEMQPYNFKRALHAARDRFTPEFAHRQDAREVSNWFEDENFENIETVDWRMMPLAAQEDFRRNTGVRAQKPLSASQVKQVYRTGS